MYPTGSNTKVNTEDWAQFRADLAATLADLGRTQEGQMVNISVRREERPVASGPRMGPGRRLIRGVFGTRVRDIDPLIQFYKFAGCLYGETAGPADSDGWVQLSADQQAGIEALGWARATGRDRGRWGYPNYCVYFPHADGVLSQPVRTPVTQPYPEVVDAERAAGLAVDTLRGPLAADTPRKLLVVRGS